MSQTAPVFDEDLRHPDLYINRELSLLAFNSRVLAQARDAQTPLIERLKFLCISSTNLDEFFEIRVAGLKQRQVAGSVQAYADNRLPQQILDLISEQAHALVAEQYQILNTELLPALKKEDIFFLTHEEWTPDQSSWLHRYFLAEVLPLLSPLGLDPAHPFPRVLNKSLAFITSLKGKDAFGRNSALAVIQAPRVLPRVILLPDLSQSGKYHFVMLSVIIKAYVNELFPGMLVEGCWQFRVTRNSDLFVDEEEVQDLLQAVEGELPGRRYGDEVRLEVVDDCPKELVYYLEREFNLTKNDIYLSQGPVNLNRLMAITQMVDRPSLQYPPFIPGSPVNLERSINIFDEINKEQSMLFHHPFQSFVPVVDFLLGAAEDPDVLAIKQTLYRTGPDSVIVNALVEAAHRGKEVTVVIELRARFEEEANISLATKLQEAGAHVVYGVVGYKTHAKMCLVIRRELGNLVNYVHMGTGNYHARTARMYTDYGLLTNDAAFGEDVGKLFLQLTSLGTVPHLSKLLQSPFSLFPSLLDKINREIEHVRLGQPARIMAKMNGLTEDQIIQALYTASRAGVQIDLIIRGICCLRPGIPGVSENIRVRSIIGRFLEHTRVYYFENAGQPEVYCSSADWMERNLHKRIETAFPIEDEKLKARLIEETFTYYLKDNIQAWQLDVDGVYRKAQPEEGVEVFSAQTTLLETLRSS